MSSFLRLKGIDKRFPGVHAVDHVDLEIERGEVHVLLGENGAGKSTLTQLLSGAQQPDEGEMYLRGNRVTIGGPRRALELGIGMVYQELSLIPSLSVAENILMGQQPRTGLGYIDWDTLHERAREALGVLEVELDPKTLVRDLEIGDQQLTEIAKIIAHDVDLIILDEPTSALTRPEYRQLVETIKTLRNQGVTFIYITHRLEEVFELGDRVTVLRDGRKVGTLSVEESTDDELVRMMVGRQLEEQYPKQKVPPGKTILEVRELSSQKLREVSFELREGEVLGIAGLLGAGRAELARILFGLTSPDSGEVLVDGEPVHLTSPIQAIEKGLGYLTKDRHEGLIERMPVDANITLSSLSKICRWQYLDHASEEELARRFVDSLDIATPSLEQLVQYLSGGNQQKVVLAKWLASDSRIFILHEPTRGIDVGTKVEVYNLMNRLASDKKGLIMISSELPELLAMSDRILVMRDGRIVSRHRAGEVTREQIIEQAAGRSQNHVR